MQESESERIALAKKRNFLYLRSCIVLSGEKDVSGNAVILVIDSVHVPMRQDVVTVLPEFVNPCGWTEDVKISDGGYRCHRTASQCVE